MPRIMPHLRKCNISDYKDPPASEGEEENGDVEEEAGLALLAQLDPINEIWECDKIKKNKSSDKEMWDCLHCAYPKL